MRIFPLMCVMSGVSNSRHSMLIGAVVTKWLTMFARRISQFMFKLTSMSLFSIVDRCFKLEFANSLLSMLSRRFRYMFMQHIHMCTRQRSIMLSHVLLFHDGGWRCMYTYIHAVLDHFNEISAIFANFSINRFVSFSFVT